MKELILKKFDKRSKWAKAVAVIMAVLMAASVLYINNMYDTASAKEEYKVSDYVTSITLSQTDIDSLFADTFTVHNNVINVASEDVEFSLPANIITFDGSVTDTSKYEYGFLEADASDPYLTAVATATDAAPKKEADVVLAPGKVKVLYIYDKITGVAFPVAKYTVNAVDLATVYTPELVFDNAGKTGTFALDSTFSETYTENATNYYGKIRYKVSADSSITSVANLASITGWKDDNQTWTTFTDAYGTTEYNDYIKKELDKTYYLAAGYFVKKDGNYVPVTLVADTDGAARDFNPVVITDLTITTSEPVTEQNGVSTWGVNGNNAAYTGGAANMNCLFDIQVSFKVDSQCTVKGPNGTPVTVVEGGTFTYTIPATAANNGVSNKEFKFTAGNGVEQNSELKLDISFRDVKPGISSIYVDGVEYTTSSGTYYTNQATTKIDIVAVSKGLVNNLMVKDFDTDALIANITDVTKGEDDKYTGSYNLTNEINVEKKYNIYAENGLAISPALPIVVYCDQENPVISGFTVSQPASGNYADYDDTDDLYTSNLPYEVFFKVTEDYSGIETVTAQKTYDDVTFTDVVVTDVDGLGTFKISESADSNNKGKTVKYVVKVQDKATNSDEKDYTIGFYNDDVTVTWDIKDDQASMNIDGSTGNGEFDIEFTIKTDIPLASGVLTVNSATTTLADTEFGTPSIEDGLYVYTYTYHVNTAVSAVYNIGLDVTTKNGCTGGDVVKIINIDLDDPQAAITSYEANGEAAVTGAPDASKWYKSLLLNFTYSDDFAAAYSSGLAAITIDQAGIYSQSEDIAIVPGAEKGGYITTEVVPSADITGTKLTLTLVDRVGKQNVYNYTFYVDNENPIANAIIDDKAPEQLNGTVIGGDSKDPIIQVGFDDNIRVASYRIDIVKPDGTTAFYANTSEDFHVDGIYKLSDIVGTLADGKYNIVITCLDLAGNPISSDKIETTFVLDNTAPVINSLTLNGETVAPADMAAYEAANKAYADLKVGVTVDDIISVSGDCVGVDTVTFIMNTDEGTTTKQFTESELGNIEVDIPESTTNDGTEVYIEVKDKLGNVTGYKWNLLSDEHSPEVTLKIDNPNYKDNDSVINGDPVIVTADSDNIIIAARSILIKKPDGSTVTYTDGSYLGSKKLSELAGSLDDGLYEITIAASDRSNPTVTSSLKVTVDNTAPVNDIAITTADPAKISKYNYKSYDGKTYGEYYSTNVTLSVASVDENTDRLLVMDNGNGIPVNWTKTTTSDGKTVHVGEVTIGAEGYHEISISNTDKAGNAGITRMLYFTIDKTAPVLSLSLNGASYAESTGVRYLNTNGNVVVGVTEVNVDDGDLVRVTRTTRPSDSTSTVQDIFTTSATTYETEADYEITYTATDKAGNVSQTRTVAFRVDKTAPELTISGAIDGGTSTKDVTVTYAMREAFYWDIVGAKVNIYKKMDGQAERLLKSIDYSAKNAQSTMADTFNEDGEYRFEFNAEDKCGNTANTSYTFILDKTAPVIELSGVANYAKTDDKVTFGIAITENFFSTNTLKINATRTDMDGKVEKIDFDTAAVNRSVLSSITKEFTEDGIYDIEVISKDKAGNESVEKIHFTIDTMDPVLSDLSEFDGTIMKEFKWKYAADDIVKDLTVCDVVIYLDGVEYDGVSEVSDGKHVLKVVATDEMGKSVDKSYEFILDTIAPIVIVTGIEDGDVILEPTEIGVSLQIDADTLDSVSLNGAAIGDPSTGSVTFTVEEAGDYEIVVKAHDEAGNTAEKVVKFTYGKKFNPLWIIIAAILLLILIIVLILVRKNRWNQKELK